jgi:arylsulfatase A-like enzyme
VSIRKFVAADLAVVAMLLPGISHQPTPAQTTQQQNIVVVVTDDQRYDQTAWMPTLQSELVQKGMSFSRFYVNNPLCCPSRATILTGTYNHTNGVYRLLNDDPCNCGGFRSFIPNESKTIAVALQNAGYRTGLFGKYLNSYDDVTHVPPGWSRWVAAYPDAIYFGQGFSVDGTEVRTLGYSTDVLAQFAADFVDSTPADQPLFAYFAPFAPHKPAHPPPRYRKAFAQQPAPRPPSYNEANVSDKPQFVQNLPPLTSKERSQMDSLYRDQLSSLLGVDDALHVLLEHLQATGRLSNTLFVFTSDNGQHLGEHRFRSTKNVAYEESIHVPLIVRWDGRIAPGTTDAHLTGAVDLAVTWAEAAGASLPGAEGMSLVPVLTGQASSWRSDMLIEGGDEQFTPFCQLHTVRFAYDWLPTGEEELYDLTSDPYQLRNVWREPAYASILAAMRARAMEVCQPLPPGF